LELQVARVEETTAVNVVEFTEVVTRAVVSQSITAPVENDPLVAVTVIVNEVLQ
jgi:hypothetical protein